MKLTTEMIKIAQRFLIENKIPVGSIDGIAGKQTKAGLVQLKDIPADWITSRKIVACIQLYCKREGIDPGLIDGYWGPDTQAAYGRLRHLLLYGSIENPWRAEDIVLSNPNHWPLQTQEALTHFYGTASPVGNPNLRTFAVPYPLKLAWNLEQEVTQITAHQKVKDSIIRVLEAVLKHYGLETIQELRLDHYGGCFSYRKIRNGGTLSTHSWGIALDFDPMHNQLKWDRSKAAFARPEYEAWWRCWEAEGWVSLGRSRNYDWMHIQAAKINS
ncbi:hypothetical protein DBR32_11185 [Taibaiella sp. KBW10]|uniref:M15 family metallopeptidase n=1 Tax=Taibaiella sp. KBW10 TaxID=2153357 RepID=UPI000F58F91E|nr:M15 family metallopeptidase [Taibaiella sp. KBW10]RQO30142.1 hypothetical protein DBR32_11185 [Taibaiella sp. KBW10]